MTRFRVDKVDGHHSPEESEDDQDDDVPGSYTRSFRHFTREALPRVDNYRNIMSIHAAYRPTLDELHDAATIHRKVIP